MTSISSRQTYNKNEIVCAASCKSFKMAIWVLLLVSGVSANDSLIRHWTVGFTGLKPVTGHLDLFTAKSLIHCANHCGLNAMCRSMFFVKDDRLCQIFAQTFQVASLGLSSETSAVYYERDDPDALPTTTTTTTTTAPSTTTTTTVAPAAFTFVTLPSGNSFQYRVFIDTPRSYSDSENVCSGLGARMYRILTTEKFIFSLQLMTDAAYNPYSFWIDGVYNVGTSQWKTSDGTQLPMTTDFWYPARPNGAGVTNCAWMHAPFGHYLDDFFCDDATYGYAICEM